MIEPILARKREIFFSISFYRDLLFLSNKFAAVKVFFITVLFFSVAQSKSQVIQIVSDSMPVTGKLSYNLYDKGKIIGKENGGTMYALPQDHMPALRPDTAVAYNMPVKTFKRNPYQSNQQFIPQNPYNRKFWKDSIIQTPITPKKKAFTP
jgi:hypothetical protein